MAQAAQEVNHTVNVGDKAPAFSVASDSGESVSLQDFAGKNVVLYFYPKDDTPGCTAESKDFRDHKTEFDGCNTVILGVSKDSVKSHVKFKGKYNLPFVLLSDEALKLCEDYGVWVEKSLYGKKYMGIDRSTFLIDGKGTVRKVWRKVKVGGHVKEVLEAAQAL
ncbi:MAG: thioredoxin-dependent thiol peroxidase [Alphaproteobacteria bacterium]